MKVERKSEMPILDSAAVEWCLLALQVKGSSPSGTLERRRKSGGKHGRKIRKDVMETKSVSMMKPMMPTLLPTKKVGDMSCPKTLNPSLRFSASPAPVSSRTRASLRETSSQQLISSPPGLSVRKKEKILETNSVSMMKPVMPVVLPVKKVDYMPLQETLKPSFKFSASPVSSRTRASLSPTSCQQLISSAPGLSVRKKGKVLETSPVSVVKPVMPVVLPLKKMDYMPLQKTLKPSMSPSALPISSRMWAETRQSTVIALSASSQQLISSPPTLIVSTSNSSTPTTPPLLYTLATATRSGVPLTLTTFCYSGSTPSAFENKSQVQPLQPTYLSMPLSPEMNHSASTNFAAPYLNSDIQILPQRDAFPVNDYFPWVQPQPQQNSSFGGQLIQVKEGEGIQAREVLQQLPLSPYQMYMQYPEYPNIAQFATNPSYQSSTFPVESHSFF